MAFWHTAIVCLLATNGLLIAVQQPVKKYRFDVLKYSAFLLSIVRTCLLFYYYYFYSLFFLLFIRSCSVVNFFWLCARVRRFQQFLVGFFLAQPKQLDDFIKGITINSQ